MSSDTALPPGFEALEQYVPRWSGLTTQARWNARATASMADIEDFYKAMFAHAERALAYLDTLSIDELPDDAGRLLRLVLSLANCAMAVELHRQPRAPFSPFPHGVTVLKGGHPFG